MTKTNLTHDIYKSCQHHIKNQGQNPLKNTEQEISKWIALIDSNCFENERRFGWKMDL